MKHEKWYLPWLTNEHFELSKQWILDKFPNYKCYQEYKNTWYDCKNCWNCDGEYDSVKCHIRNGYGEITLEEFKAYIFNIEPDYLLFN